MTSLPGTAKRLRTLEPGRQTLGELLARAADSSEFGLRVLDRNLVATWLPWSIVFERALATANWLRDVGVRPGDRVGLVFPTEPSFFDAFFGVVLAGAVPAPIYPPVRLGRLDEYRARTARMLQSIEACLLLTDRRAYRILGEVSLAARPPLGCRVLRDPALSSSTSALPQKPCVRDEDDLALIQFSSGTTVEPKPVALTQHAVVAQARILNSYWPDTDTVRHSGVSWLPLYHDMGLIGCVFTAMERPGTVTLIPPEMFIARPAVWLQTISRYRATVSPGPNFAYSLAVNKIADEELEDVDLSCWRVALCGAEAVVPDVMRSFRTRFSRWRFPAEALTPVYGLSEAALAVTFSDPDRPFLARRFDRRCLAEEQRAVEAEEGREVVSVGRAVPGFSVRVVANDGNPLPEGHVGLIECSGPSVMKGYFGDSETTTLLGDGWLSTGDTGFFYEGELFVTGRQKDLLIIRGANHSPEEVESAVQGVDGVRAGCVVAVSWLPEDASGEQLLVFVEARTGVGEDRFPEIMGACARAVLSATGLITDKVVVLRPGTLPRTSSGKLRRQDALQQYLASTLAAPAPVTPVRLAAALARSALAHWGQVLLAHILHVRHRR